MLLEPLAILLLILMNGFFAMAELAVVSAKRARLEVMEDAGNKSAGLARTLAEEPERFLPTVQIGITLIGVLAGALSGATVAERLAAWMRDVPLLAPVANGLSIAVVVVIVTYLSLVLGELVPKRLALRRPEPIAAFVAWPLDTLSRVAAPMVFLLHISTEGVLRLLGAHRDVEPTVTEAEIRTIIEEGAEHGVIEEEEREMISGVMRLADRTVVGLMTPRTDVDWIDVGAPVEEIRQQLIEAPHSLIPVGEGSIDTLVGIVRARDLLAEVLSGKPLDVRPNIRKVPIIPETMDALDALDILRKADVPVALIHDEYGHFEGLVTPADVLEAIVGAFKSEDEGPDAVQRANGSWLIAGSMPVDEMADRLGLTLPPKRSYATVAGFVLAHLQHIPKTGESIDTDGWHFEVVDLDGHRIDKVLASRVKNPS